MLYAFLAVVRYHAFVLALRVAAVFVALVMLGLIAWLIQ